MHSIHARQSCIQCTRVSPSSPLSPARPSGPNSSDAHQTLIAARCLVRAGTCTRSAPCMALHVWRCMYAFACVPFFMRDSDSDADTDAQTGAATWRHMHIYIHNTYTWQDLEEQCSPRKSWFWWRSTKSSQTLSTWYSLSTYSSFPTCMRSR